MKHHLQLEKSYKAAIKFKRWLSTDIEMESVPLMKLSSLPEHIHVRTWEASQNADHDMQELLRVDKASPAKQGELATYSSKLMEIDKSIKKR